MTEVAIGRRKRSGLRLFSLFGIEVRLDVSVLLIFGLIVYSLGAGLLPGWHPQWSAALTWMTALVAGVVFFASLLAHELSHSLVARRFGIRVPRITLFLFGGMAEMDSEAKTPGAEFAIAIAGPLMSLFLGVLFTTLATTALDGDTLDRLLADPAGAMAGLGPAATACLWLGSVNVMLAVFNMLPGFPLDGGRVFRAVVWRLTGDYLLATRLASTAGRLFGWGLMALGFWNLLALGSPGGLWLILIGWFLSYLAAASYTQQLTLTTLRALKVRDIMRTQFEHVPAGVSIETFVEDYLLRSNQSLWPVLDEGRLVGLISTKDVTRIPVAERREKQVSAVMSPVGGGAPDSGARVDGGGADNGGDGGGVVGRTIDEDVPATEALGALLARRDEPVAVMRDGRVTGLLGGADILRWVALHQDRES